jgi:hypothetical protein
VFPKLTAFAGALVLALVLAACGADDDAGSSSDFGTGPPLTPEAFVVQGNAICTAEEQKVNAARGQLPGGGGTQVDIEKFNTTVVIPSVEARIAALRQLSPPEDDADEFGEFLDTAQEALDEAKEDPSVLTDTESPFIETQQQALDLGLRECAD